MAAEEEEEETQKKKEEEEGNTSHVVNKQWRVFTVGSEQKYVSMIFLNI